jgi:hypothetical protein
MLIKQVADILRKINWLPSEQAKTTPMLGRWCVLNKHHNNRKIDMANIDHCGTCYYDYKKGSNMVDIKKKTPPNNATSV